MAARVHLMAMGLIIIASGCLPSRRIIFGQRPMRPALILSGRHATARSRKRSLSVGTRDSAGRTPDQYTKNDGAETKTARILVGLKIAPELVSELAELTAGLAQSCIRSGRSN